MGTTRCILLLALLSELVLAHAGHTTPAVVTEQCGRADSGGSTLQILSLCPVPRTEDVAAEPFSWGTWTHKPWCIKNYCVFTNAMFRANQGVSFITTRRRTKTLPTEAINRNSSDSGPTDLPFETKSIPGKGIGTVAIRKIRQDEIILIDAASLIADADIPAKLDRGTGVQLFNHAVDQLSDPQQLLKLSTRDMDGKSSVAEDVLMTNSFSLPVKGIKRMLLFPRIAVRIPH